TQERVTELGAVLAGDAPGRPGPDAVTLFDSTGLAIQDLAVAAGAPRGGGRVCRLGGAGAGGVGGWKGRRSRPGLERDVPVLALGAGLALGLERVQRGDDLGSRLVGDDHVVDVAPLGRAVRVGEAQLVVV